MGDALIAGISLRVDAYSLPLDLTIRIPPLATSLNLTWKPRKSDPTTMNTPKGLVGYSISGKKVPARRKEMATLVGW